MEKIITKSSPTVNSDNKNNTFATGRRDFLKTTALVAAGLALSSPALRAFAPKNENNAKLFNTEGKWIPSTCQGCTTWCAVEIFVQNGRAVKVRGNQHSKTSEGYVCPKGHLLINELYDPDRIKVPMKRTNPNKGVNENPNFIPISWDEALETIAEKMVELRNTEETHKFMVLRGRYAGYQNELIYSSLPKIFGSPNGISHSAICAEAEKFGPYYTEGYWGYRDYDLMGTKYLLLWGVDPLSSNRQIPNAINKFGKVLDRATVATVDPRMSTSAVKSHEWLAIKPGEDGALATAIAHVILTEGLWNKEFVGDFNNGANQFSAGQTIDESSFTESYTHGLIKWWNLELKDRTPEWAAEITNVSKEQIIRVARGLGEAAPKACVWLGPGPVMSPRGAYIAMAVHVLNGLLGSADNEGGTLRASSISTGSFPSISDYQDALAKEGASQQKIDQRGYKTFPALKGGKSGGGVVTNNVANAMLQEDPYDIKVAIGYWCNFNFSGGQGQRWDEALSKLPFFAHITTNASEMTHFADIVLPAAHHATEKWAASASIGNLHRFYSIQQPVVERIWDVKADENEIMWELAIKLKDKGFSNYFDYFNNEFKDPDTGASPNNATEFAEISTKIRSKPVYDKLGGWVEFKEIGILNSEPYEFRKMWDNFGTVTKKFEFFSETLKKALETHSEKHNTTVDDIMLSNNYTAQGEQAFVPHYEPPLRIGDKNEYPYEFIDFKSKLNREGRSQNIPWYYEFKKVDVGDNIWQDVVQINPKDANKLNIQDGDKVKITSTIASIEAVAKLWEGVGEGVIAKCFGQGHKYYGKVASLDFSKGTPRGSNNNDIMPDEYDRFSGSTCRNGGFFGVKVEKVTTSIFATDEKPNHKISIGAIYPNPAKDYATFNISLKDRTQVRIGVYDVSGRKVLDVQNGVLSFGNHTLRIDTSALDNGMYICHIQTDNYRNALKLIVAK